MSILHVGYNIALGDFVNFLQTYFSYEQIPEQVTCAVMHNQSEGWRNYRNDNNATGTEMRQWIEKSKPTIAYVTNLYSYSKARNPPKNTKFDRLIVARVTIDGKPFYVNIFNNTAIPPIEVKKFLCSNEKAFQEVPVERFELTCTPYEYIDSFSVQTKRLLMKSR